MQEDSVSTFLHKVDEQEKEDAKKQDEDAKQRAFEASVMFGQSDSSSAVDGDDQQQQ